MTNFTEHACSFHLAPSRTLLRSPIRESAAQIDERKFWCSLAWSELGASVTLPSEVALIGVQPVDQAAVKRAIQSIFPVDCRFVGASDDYFPGLLQVEGSRLILAGGYGVGQKLFRNDSAPESILTKPLEAILAAQMIGPELGAANLMNATELLLQTAPGQLVEASRMIEHKLSFRDILRHRRRQNVGEEMGLRLNTGGSWGGHALYISSAPSASSREIQVSTLRLKVGSRSGLWSDRSKCRQLFAWLSEKAAMKLPSAGKFVVCDHDAARVGQLIAELNLYEESKDVKITAPDLVAGYHPALTRLQFLSDESASGLLIDSGNFPYVFAAVRRAGGARP